jgi:hypothetical protein
MKQPLFAISVCLLLTARAAAQPPLNSASDKPAGSESLGNQLLDDLVPLAPPKSPDPARDEQNQSSARNATMRAQRSADDLGEDIGQPSGPLPLVRVRQGMQQAERLLNPPLTATNAQSLNQAGAVQQQVVKHLDELIAELSKQCQACRPGGQQSQSGQTQASQKQQQAGQSSATAARGSTAAQDSTTRLGQSTGQPAANDKTDIDNLMKALWGHLPDRNREQMLQSFSHEFLPKYELEIEEYYRRLSEEQDANRATQ